MKYFYQLSKLIIIISFLSTSIFSQAELVKDINPGKNGNYGSETYVFGNKLLMEANDGVHGKELWFSDGTEAGTKMIKDIWKGSSQSYIDVLSVQKSLVYFSADDGIHGQELWISDGTDVGTYMVKDINQGLDDAFSFNKAVFYNNKLIFEVKNKNEWQIWTSNGTEAGTKKIYTICDFCNGPKVKSWVLYKDQVYFNTLDQIYSTRGNESDINKVYGKVDDPEFDSAQEMTLQNNNLYFEAGSWTSKEEEPWISDGTKGGTHRLADLNPNGPSDPHKFVTYKGHVYFIANNNIYKTDGTESGTKIFYPLNKRGDNIREGFLEVFLNKLFFYEEVGSNNTFLSVIEEDTSKIERLLQISFVITDESNNYTDYNGLVYFQGPDTEKKDVYNQELLSTDGTIKNTIQIADISKSTVFEGSDPTNLQIVGNYLYFIADDQVHGSELWRYKIDSTTSNFNLNNISLNQFHLSPNPVTNHFKLKLRNDASLDGTKASLEIHDLKGELVYNKDVMINNEHIQVNNLELNNGMYILNLKTIRGMEVHKLVVSK